MRAGSFSETWNRARLSEHGIDIDFVQDNHSLSAAVGTVRGLHFQAPPHAQAKLVRCGRGALFDVAVDIRKGSPTYGRWFGVELSFENGKQLLIPAGFAHGFATREPDTEIIYKCSDTTRRRPRARCATTIPISASTGALEQRGDPVGQGCGAAGLRRVRQPVRLRGEALT
jgi:dTDP-4-dehydrorhamnose 3,5-epimerase